MYPPANKGTFYFADKNYCVPSSVRFNGKWYKNVPVLYDVHNDVMVSFSGNFLFTLNTNRISDVYLLDHHFINITDKDKNGLAGGFYDLMYSGRTEILVKRSKTVEDDLRNINFVETFYVDKSDVYARKDDRYYLVNDKSSFLDLFKDQKKALKQYMKDHKIDYKKDKESASVKLAGYYDQITK
jgi:hypothetical protein